MLYITFNLFLTGILFGSGPCMASCGPILTSYVLGTRKTPAQSALAYGVFSLSRVVVYIILSLIVFFMGGLTLERLLGNSYKYVVLIGGGFIIIIGLMMIIGRSIDLGLCRSLNRIFLEKDKKSVILLGVIIGLLPCAPLIAILSYIGLVSKNWLQGALLGLSYGIGTVISPLVVLVFCAGFVTKFFGKRINLYYKVASIVCGSIIVFLGINLILAAFKN